MFTGLVREVGRLVSFTDGRLVVECATSAAAGDSVSVDGVCLTVTDVGDGTLAFHVVPETLSRTKPFGELFNVDPELRAGDQL